MIFCNIYINAHAQTTALSAAKLAGQRVTSNFKPSLFFEAKESLWSSNMSVGAGPSKKTKTYHFHAKWEVDFFHDVIFEMYIPHLPVYTIAIPTKSDVKRHFRTVHEKYDTDFPPKSELRKKG